MPDTETARVVPSPIPETMPGFTVAAAEALAREHYGFSGTGQALASERDQNFVIASGRERIVLKIANTSEERGMLDAQQQAMARLAASGLVPRVVASVGGDSVVEVPSPSGERHFVWAVSWLPGVPLGMVGHRSPELLEDVGRRVGGVSHALAGFDHPAIHREFYWDLDRARRVVTAYRTLIDDADIGVTVDALVGQFDLRTAPLLPQLRRSAIHNDLNDYNILVGGGQPGAFETWNQHVAGIVDFGDMVYGCTVGDLAIATAYAILDSPDPLAAAAAVVRGAHSVFALTDAELAALYGLVVLRLCASVCIAATQLRQRPGNAYLGVSQAAIRRTLPLLAATPFGLAEGIFRDACGLAPFPATERVVSWLERRSHELASVLGVDLQREPCIVLDLGVSSPLVHGDARENAEPALTRRVASAMGDAGARIAVGQYDEPRLLYVAPSFAVGSTGEHRTLHLGLDLFAKAGTPVHAPCAGVVHAFADNDAPQDYGPVIVLRHATEDDTEFFTLYGHLSRESLAGLRVGRPVARGERFAALGAPEVNGGWTPHLHLQVITDLLDLGCDFPGVGRMSQRSAWRGLCPDPNLIARVPADRFPPPPPGKSETLALRRLRVGRNLSVAYRDPVKIVRGWKQFLFDDEGRRYVDAYNNVPHVGHCHPRVVRAGQAQMAVLNTNTRYLSDLTNDYAARLSATLPAPLRVCFFLNSASEANELAVRLARAHTGSRDMVVLAAAYHGHTTTLVDVSPYKHAGPGGEGPPDWVHVAPLPDDYRGAHKRGDPAAGHKYAAGVGEIVAELRTSGRRLAGFLAETCPSVGGQLLLPPGYLAEVYRYVRGAGGVCIADEVQTGLGRMGTHFWAFEAHDVVPDIVVAGKPLGNGHPMAAVVTTSAIADSFDNGMEFFSTFGGNTVSCAIGLAVLDVLRDEGLQAHARRVGEGLLAGLRSLARQHEIVGDVRGSGLFLGVELVRDRVTLEPAGAEAAFVANRMRERGFLLGTDGPYHNVVKIRPPLPFDEHDATRLLEALHRVLKMVIR